MSYLGGGECTNHADCLRSRRTGLSPPAVYPTIPAEHETNKGNLRPRHYAYAFDYYSRVAQGYPVFIRGPLLEYPLRERTMNPRTNENKRITLLELTKYKYPDMYSKCTVSIEVQGRRDADKS